MKERELKNQLKRHLKQKGYRTKITTITEPHINAGRLVVELKGTDEHLFIKELAKVCVPGQRVSPGTYVVDPGTIKIGG